MSELNELLNTPITVTPNEIMCAVSEAGAKEIINNPSMAVFIDEIARICGHAVSILIRSKKEDK